MVTSKWRCFKLFFFFFQKEFCDYLDKKNKWLHALREQVKKRDDLLKSFDSKKHDWQGNYLFILKYFFFIFFIFCILFLIEMKRKGKADMSKVMAAEEKMRKAKSDYSSLHEVVKKYETWLLQKQK